MIRLSERRADTIYGFSKKSVEFRRRWRGIVAIGLFLGLSLLASLISYNQFNSPAQKISLLVLNAVKYLPLLWAVYKTAKNQAAQYLDDIYELNDVSLAESFIENVAFGGKEESLSFNFMKKSTDEEDDEEEEDVEEEEDFATQSKAKQSSSDGKIIINEGKVIKQDEKSPLILIGGPGYIKVNLGSAALLEQIDGSPRVISANHKTWKVNSFERLREIGEEDEIEKREYATINLQEQFVAGIEVKSRTKDGIPIEARDIKVIFHVVRDPQSNDPYSFDRDAVASLIYKQTLITPKPEKNYGVSFPWDMSAIPLIKDEMEKLISSKALSEILSSVSQKELDYLKEDETSNTQMRVEITGQLTRATSENKMKLRSFETRPEITNRFFEKAFIQKASELGIALQWIDVGTWYLPSPAIQESLKNAYELKEKNAKSKFAVEQSAKKIELEKMLELIKNSIIDPYDKASLPKNLDYEELLILSYFEKTQANDPNYQFMKGMQQPESKWIQPKNANAKAIDILKIIRKELIAAIELIQRDHTSPVEKQQEIDRIRRAIEHIEYFIFRKIK